MVGELGEFSMGTTNVSVLSCAELGDVGLSRISISLMVHLGASTELVHDLHGRQSGG